MNWKRKKREKDFETTRATYSADNGDQYEEKTLKIESLKNYFGEHAYYDSINGYFVLNVCGIDAIKLDQDGKPIIKEGQLAVARADPDKYCKNLLYLCTPLIDSKKEATEAEAKTSSNNSGSDDDGSRSGVTSRERIPWELDDDERDGR